MTEGIIRAPASNSDISKLVLQCCGKKMLLLLFGSKVHKKPKYVVHTLS